MNCLWCREPNRPAPTWRTWFSVDVHHGLCENCNGQLAPLHGVKLCRICGRDLDELASEFYEGESCNDCKRWGEATWGNCLRKNVSVFKYNSFMQTYIARFKYRGDAILAEAFRGQLNALFKKHYKKYVAVPIPLSEARHSERFFNQAELLAYLLETDQLMALERKLHTEKQSKKVRRERLELKEDVFKLKSDTAGKLKGKPIVIIDDIYTTGATLRQAARVLHGAEPADVCALTLARG